MKFFYTALLFLAPLILFSQEKNRSEIIVAKWRKGETKTIYISHTKEKSEDGNTKEDPFKLSYTATIIVLDSTEDGYKMKWTFELDEAFKKEYPGIGEMLPVYNGLEFFYTTESSGEFRELLNWEEVREAYIEMALVSMPRKNNDSIVNLVLEKTKQMFNSRQLVESALIKEIQLYHMPYGGEFNTKGISSPTLLPNPFGGEPMAAIASQKLSNYAEDGKSFTINFQTELDSSGMKIMMNSLFKSMDLPIKGNGKDSIDAAMKQALSNFQMTDNTEARITKPGNWTTFIKFSRKANTVIIKQKEEFVFRMKE